MDASDGSWVLFLETSLRLYLCIRLGPAKVSVLEHFTSCLLIAVVIKRLVTHACAAFILFVSTWCPSARKR
jgi:hypothetical protein